MDIPENILDLWQPYISHGDIKLIAEQEPIIHVATIQRALKTRRCSDAVFQRLSDFYSKKMIMVKEAAENGAK